MAEVRALKMVLLPTLGRPTIPQFRGIVWVGPSGLLKHVGGGG